MTERNGVKAVSCLLDSRFQWHVKGFHISDFDVSIAVASTSCQEI